MPLLQVFRLFQRNVNYTLRVRATAPTDTYLTERECLAYFFDERHIHAKIGAIRID